jgi:hypothetical protein
VALRRVLTARGAQDRGALLRLLARELGRVRLGPRLRRQLGSVLAAAARRGVIRTADGAVFLAWPSYHEAARDAQKSAFLAALGRAWVSRDEAMTRAARFGGFGRVSPKMRVVFASLINGLLRERRLEASGDCIRRA